MEKINEIKKSPAKSMSKVFDKLEKIVEKSMNQITYLESKDKPDVKLLDNKFKRSKESFKTSIERGNEELNQKS